MSHDSNGLGKSTQTRIHNITGTQVQALLAKLDILKPHLNLDFPLEELSWSNGQRRKQPSNNPIVNTATRVLAPPERYNDERARVPTGVMSQPRDSRSPCRYRDHVLFEWVNVFPYIQNQTMREKPPPRSINQTRWWEPC